MPLSISINKYSKAEEQIWNMILKFPSFLRYVPHDTNIHNTEHFSKA